jgi:hypothetical protein
MESELFHNITLQPGQNIANYFSSIVDKGQLLQKPEHEIMAKFITGLPVKCGNPACLINEAHSKLSRIQTQPKIVWRYLVGIH